MSLEVMVVPISAGVSHVSVKTNDGRIYIVMVAETEDGLEIGKPHLAGIPVGARPADTIGSHGFIDR